MKHTDNETMWFGLGIATGALLSLALGWLGVLIFGLWP